MKKIIFAVLIIFLLTGCTAPDRTKETLEKAGYANIETGEYDFWSCGKDDDFATKFTADNPAGQRVSGTVCCGFLKGCTIRF